MGIQDGMFVHNDMIDVDTIIEDTCQQWRSGRNVLLAYMTCL